MCLVDSISAKIIFIISKLSDGPSILIGISIGLLTILIPIALAIFRDEKKFKVLDTYIFWDYILKAKWFFIIMAFIFLPPLLWEILPVAFRGLLLLPWAAGCLYIISIMRKSYLWTKGKDYELRFRYLEKLKNEKDLLESWNSVWQAKDIGQQKEGKFWELFSGTIDRLRAQRNSAIETMERLLENFAGLMQKRKTNISFITRLWLPKVLDWHYKYRSNAGEGIELSDRELKNYRIRYVLSEMVRSWGRQSLKEPSSFVFFISCKNHIQSILDGCEKPDQNLLDYLLSLSDLLIPTLLENIHDSPFRREILENYFPKEWKITKANFLKSTNPMPRLVYGYFEQWAVPRILDPKNEFDQELDDVSRYLFPEANPIDWATILRFVYVTGFADYGIQAVIERLWTFGKFGRIFSFAVVGDDDRRDEIRKGLQADQQRTYELALVLFGQIFSEANLNEYLKEVDKLIAKEDYQHKDKCLKLKNILTEILKYIEPNQ